MRLPSWRDRFGVRPIYTLIIAVVVGVMLLASAIGIGMFADRRACEDRAAIKGYDYTWSVWAGCLYVKDKDDDATTVEVV